MGRGMKATVKDNAAAVLLVLALLPTFAGAEVVTIALTDGTALRAHWFPAKSASPRPAVVALHGCGGLYKRDGATLDERYPDYIERFHRAGYHVLLPDSLRSRGVRSLCTTPSAERSVKIDTRRGDAAAAVQWAAARPEVDARRIALFGWSHGASTTLAAINTERTGSAAPLAAAVVLYPGCTAFLRRSFTLREPLLMLLAADDDWTPPGPCVKLAESIRARQPSADLTLRVYEESVHGFDSARPVRFRKDVPNGEDPAGVHVGGNPKARAAALAEIEAFLARFLGT